MTLRIALDKSMDTTANQMDSLRHLGHAIKYQLKAIECSKETSSEIEGQMKLRKVRKGEYTNEFKNSH